IYMVGSYSWLLDLAALAVAAAAVTLVAAAWLRHRRRGDAEASHRWRMSTRASTVIAIGFVAAWWLAVTAADTVVMRQAARRDWGSGLSTCPEGLARPDWQELRPPRVAVAVSGGGYRAALFHAGVLAGLTCIQVPVSGLSTVSGGSIIGAYYAVGGEPHGFRSMVTAGLFNVKRELLHVDNALRFAWSLVVGAVGRDHPDTRFTQTEVQASLLDRLLYRGLRMADLDSLGDPRLLVNVTDLVSSERIGLTPRGVLQPISYDPVNRQDYANPTGLVGFFGDFAAFRDAVPERWPANELLSRVVAASGAFPGAMRPVAVFAPKEVSLDTTQAGWYVFADGGIADNTGLASVRDAIGLARDYAIYKRCASGLAPDTSSRSIEARCGERPWGVSAALEPWLVDVIVMSDGSAMSKAVTPTTTLAELGRTADVMYRMSGPQRPAPDDTTVALTPVLLISPKAFQRGAEDSLYWTNPLEAASARNAHRAYRSLHLWSFDIDVGTIGFMVAHMPEPERARATEALRTAEAEGRIRDGRWMGASDASQPPTEAERTLHGLLKNELRDRIAVFATTSTLRDQLDAGAAESLFLLGKYLVLINRHSLHEQVARAVYPRTWESRASATPPAPASDTAAAAPLP
ncbi:MAG: patatin-like phospholipase family protein, partial [Gemmatimonadota bacterium]|nr:patatin-like phospholipase family protein [Gemmatimonadota bacterium]